MVSSQMGTRDARSVSCVVSEALVSEAALREGGMWNRSTLSVGTSIPRRVYLQPAPVQMKMEI